MINEIALSGENGMSKIKTTFVCSDCGAEYQKWQGRCSACNAWNTLSEIRLPSKKNIGNNRIVRGGFAGKTASIQLLAEIKTESLSRSTTGFAELDRVLGGGFVSGSTILIGGSPGTGKSTILLQVLGRMACEAPVLYVTGEESLQQIAIRASRLGITGEALHLMAETDVDEILSAVDTQKPAILVVDSIQVVQTESLSSAPGSVAQVRDCAAILTRYAKTLGTVLILVGHVTKEGGLAGPKVLEHMIDCSLLLEGDQDSRFRTLRCKKNRFGSVNELGVFAMTDTGLKEVANPSAIFLEYSGSPAPGTIVVSIWEGTRPLLVEVQALVDPTNLGNPRRLAVGFEHNRLAMLLAILHRHAGIQVGDHDVFANVVGGIRVTETSADLALLLAVVSSLRDRVLSRDLVVFGEVGLSGEIRPVASGQERIAEAVKHGFKQAIVPKANLSKKQIRGIKVTGVSRLAEAIAMIF